MRQIAFAALGAALCVAALPAFTALAADASYMGVWRISAAVLAPWADPAQKPDGGEPARLIGKTIMFKEKEIAGPQPFACKGAKYKVSDYTASLLFQGAFDEMHARNGSADTEKLAASIGFSGAKIKTLETGCEFDFHFADDGSAKTGLNDYVYTLRKQ
ncbi:MAG: hypothetical protein ACLPPF_13755 [Rhodomicrobium sp.]